MTVAWPASLSTKKLAVSGYAEGAGVDPTIRTNMDSGPPKSRARFTAFPKKIEGAIDTMTSTDVDNLLDFWENTCSMGSLPFTWTHPRTGSSVTFIWMKYPDITPSNGSPILYNATLSLLILP